MGRAVGIHSSFDDFSLAPEDIGLPDSHHRGFVTARNGTFGPASAYRVAAVPQ
jgi:hypothetical protein